jgi:isopentenyl-diphosphate delta-isomerase
MILTDLILVDESDQPVGTMEKMEAHRKGLLHRAFSIFIFNKKGEMLLQQRAAGKYHSAGLWTNACCSHPHPGQETIPAAHARLAFEMGINTGLEEIFSFTYHASFDNGLIEHEFDHVFYGTWEGPVAPNPAEVQDYCFTPIKDLANSVQSHPEKYTAWFRIAFPLIQQWMEDNATAREVA